MDEKRSKRRFLLFTFANIGPPAAPTPSHTHTQQHSSSTTMADALNLSVLKRHDPSVEEVRRSGERREEKSKRPPGRRVHARVLPRPSAPFHAAALRRLGDARPQQTCREDETTKHRRAHWSPAGRLHTTTTDPFR
jgi:hypothetical protein